MRLFLAADIPAAVRSRLASIQERLKPSLPGWRWIRPEGIHLTLRFLGEVGPELDATAREAWRQACARATPFRIRLGSVGRFPRAGRPRVLWLGISELEPGGALVSLAEGVEQAARSVGFEAERRPFSPHLTLARAARGKRAAWPDGIDLEAGDVFDVDRLILFRSKLDPAGARYTALAGFGLGSGEEM